MNAKHSAMGSYATFVILLHISATLGVSFRVKPPLTTNVQLGQSVTLRCAFDNVSRSDILLWKKDGDILFLGNQMGASFSDSFILVTTDGNYDLTIQSATLQEQGTYVCKAFSMTVGGTSTLTVLVAPGDPVIATNNKASSNETNVVQLNCSSSGGNPPPVATWWIGTEEIPVAAIQHVPPPTLGGATLSILTRTLTRTDDKKTFACKVKNEAITNPKEATHTMIVQYGPSVSLGVYNPLVVLDGSNAQLRCSVDSNPQVFTVQWFKNGQPVIGNTGRDLEFRPAQQVNNAQYTCSAHNIIGRANKTIQVTIQYPPRLTVPAQKVVNESQDVVVMCSVDAKPAPHTTQWTKDNSSSFVQSTNRLKLVNVRRSAAGLYKCSATNKLTPSAAPEYDDTKSASTRIIVQYLPGNAEISATDSVSVGQKIIVNCHAQDSNRGVPEADFIWRYAGSTNVIATGQQYSKDNAQLSDNGKIECLLRNIMGMGQPARATVEVNEPPQFLAPNPPIQEQVEKTRKSYSIKCRARGRPRPLIRWARNLKFIEDMANYEDYYGLTTDVQPIDIHSENVTSTLIFRGNGRQNNELRVEDAGNYTCHVTSNLISAARVRSSVLTVKYEPSIQNGVILSKVAAILNETAVLRCQVKAVPKADFVWQRKGTILTTGGRFLITTVTSGQTYTSTLRISAAGQDDFGAFTCIATNTQGSSTFSIDLTVKTIPEPPTSLKVELITWESAKLTWTPGFDGGFSQLFHVYIWGPDGYFQTYKNLKSSPLNVSGLIPASNYRFQVHASNIRGNGEYSAPVNATTTALDLPSVGLPKLDISKGVVKYSVSDANICVRIETLLKGEDKQWTLDEECHPPVAGDGNSYSIKNIGQVSAVRLFICLQRRPDVCGSPIEAEKFGDSTKEDIPQETIIIVGAVCGGVVLVLCLILVFVCCMRRKRAKKAGYESESGRSSIPADNSHSNAPRPNTVTNNQRSAYDNPALQTRDNMDEVDFDDPSSGGVFSTQQNPNYYNNKYPSNGGLENGIPATTDWNAYNGTAMYGDNRKNELDEEEMNRRNKPYLHLHDPPYISARDLKKPPPLNLNQKPDQNHYSPHNESGYSTPDPTKPKKVIYEVIV